MALTQKQEAFCVRYIVSGNASEAYREAYDATRMAADAVAVEGSRLLKNPKITLRLTELRAPAIEEAQITLKAHLDDLKLLRDQSAAAEQFGAAISAEVSRGRASGLYVDKSDVTVTQTTYVVEVPAKHTSPVTWQRQYSKN